MKDDEKAKDKDELGKSPVKKDEKKLSSAVSNKKIRELAEAYMRKKGMTMLHPKLTFDVSPERGAKIAKAYEEMKHEPENPKVKKAYDALIRETLDQWNEIRKTGLKVTKIAPDMENPYPGGSKDVLKDISENNHLFYFPTEQGYGSTEVSSHPLLQKVKVDGEEVPANDVFRIVHDYFGHAKEGHSFGPQGEENAWMTHKQMYSPEAQKALTAETRGQNSWVNFGPFGEQNRKDPSKTTYAEQKAGLLPDWAVDEEPTTGREKMADGGRVMMQDGGDPAEAFAAPDTTPMPEATPMPAPTPEPVTPSVTQMPELGQPAAPEEKPLATTITREYAPLWDVSGPQPKLVQMPHDRVNESIQSGKYSFDKLAQIPVIAPDGEIGTMPADKFYESVQNKEGFTYATPKQVTEYEYGGAGQQAIAFAEGLARGALSAPVATGIEKALGVDPEAILGRDEAGMAGSAGEIAGFVAPLVLTGGAWAAEKLGAEAVGAGLKGAAQVAAKAPLPLLATKLGQIVPEGSKFISRVPLNFARGAIEGAVFGVSDQLGEAMLNAPDQTAQSALAAVGLSALVNGAFGAAFGAVGDGYKMYRAKKLGREPAFGEPVAGEPAAGEPAEGGSPFFTPEELSAAGISPARRIKVSEAPMEAPAPPKEYFPEVAEDVPTSKLKPDETPEQALKPLSEREDEVLEQLERATKGPEAVPPKPDVEGLYSDEGFWVKPEDIEKYERGDLRTWLNYHPKLTENTRIRNQLEKWLEKSGFGAKEEAREVEHAMNLLTDGTITHENIPLPYITDAKLVHLMFDRMVNMPVFGSTKAMKTLENIEVYKTRAIQKLVGKIFSKSESELGQMYKDALYGTYKAKKAAFRDPYEVVDNILASIPVTPEEKTALIETLELSKKGLFPKTDAAKIKAIDDAIVDLQEADSVLRVRDLLKATQRQKSIAFRKGDMDAVSGYYKVTDALKAYENKIGEGLPYDPRIKSDKIREGLLKLWPKKLEADAQYAKFADELTFIGELTGAPKKALDSPAKVLEYLQELSPDELFKKLNLKKLNYNEIKNLSEQFPEFLSVYRGVEKQRFLNDAATKKSASEKNSLLNNLRKMPEDQKSLLFNDEKDRELLDALLTVSKHSDWQKNFSNTALSEMIGQIASATPAGLLLRAKEGAAYRIAERSARKMINYSRGIRSAPKYTTATGKEAPGQSSPLKGKVYSPKRKQFATGGMVEADAPEFDYNPQHTFVQAVNQPPKMQQANRLAQAIIKGDKMVTNSVKSIFDPKSTYKIAQADPKNVEKLKAFVDKAHNDPTGIMALGSDIIPEFNGAMTQAASSAVGYIKSLQPPPPKDLPFDTGVKAPPSAHQDIYNHVLRVTEQPLSILHKVKQGTVIPEEVGAVKTIYPALYQKLQNQITEHLIESKTKGGSIPYKTKIGLSAFLGSPIDTTFTPESIQAAQPMQQNQPPQGAQTGVQPKRSTSGLDKMATMAQTPGQARVAERSQGK